MQEPASAGDKLQQALGELTAEHYQRAHQLAMEVLKENPRDPGGYFVMAQIAHRHGNIAKAEEILGRGLGFEPGHVDSRLFRAQCLLELNRHESAKALVAGFTDEALPGAHQTGDGR